MRRGGRTHGVRYRAGSCIRSQPSATPAPRRDAPVPWGGGGTEELNPTFFHRPSPLSGGSLTEKKKGKKSVPEPVFPKKPGGTPCAQPWLVAVGGWRLAVGGGWRLAVGNWRLVAVGGGWRRLVVGDRWLVAVGNGWQLAVGRRWRLAAVGGGWWLAVGAGWRLMGVGGWQLVVPWGGP